MRDIEETLTRELREVADGLRVPPLPAVSPDPSRRWLPALAAAAVLLVVLGVVAVVANGRDEQAPEPAPTPTPSEAQAPERISRAAPTIPYVLGQRLYVDGEQVPGEWWSVDFGGDVWLGWRRDYTWWWGRGTDAQQIPVGFEIAPAISPNGEYIAYIADEGGMLLTGFETASDGEGLGGVPVESPPRFSSQPSPRAVTDDGRVVVTGGGVSMLWQPLAGGGTVDLTETAPGQLVVDSTPAGLLVTTSDESEQYLAEISETGELTRIGDLPPSQALVVSPGASRMAWTPLGTLGGEVMTVDALEVGTVGGTEQATLRAPDGFAFTVERWVWEADDFLVAPLTVTTARGITEDELLARCSPETLRCLLLDAP